MISKEDIEHLKDLARVEFGKNETEKLAEDLGVILAHMDSLKDADVSGAPETARAIDIKNVFKKDELAARDAEADQYQTAIALINAFPEKYEAGHGTYLKVKSIL